MKKFTALMLLVLVSLPFVSMPVLAKDKSGNTSAGEEMEDETKGMPSLYQQKLDDSIDRLEEQRIDRQEKINELQAERMEKRDEIQDTVLERKCSNVSAKVEQEIVRYEEHHLNQIQVYQRIKLNLQNANQRLIALGYDTSAVVVALQQFDQLVREYDALHTQFQTRLNESTVLACGDGSGDYRAKIGEANAALALMRSKRQEITAHYRNVIRQALEDLRNQQPVSFPAI